MASSGAADLDARIMAGLKTAARDTALLIANRARQRIPVRTGTARRLITVDGPEVQGQTVTVSVGGPEEVRRLEYGTASFSTDPNIPGSKKVPYIIKPRFKKALAWPAASGPSPMSAQRPGVPLAQYGSSYVTLGGRVRTPIKRLAQAGRIPYASVYSHPVRQVIHPGIRPRPFLGPAVEDTVDDALTLIVDAITAAFGV